MSEEQRYIVTARKWRPLRFADVVGQEHITTTLKNAIASGRIHHAYLFTGPRGVGKTTCARILARALNCPNGQDHEPCNVCSSCTDMLEGRSVDIVEIDGASNNSVDDVRKLRDSVKYAPLSGKYKMYIIDEVHMLSTAAFNALLKTLEEPPDHAIFVFATTEIHKLPATILSRCQRFDFRRMEIETIMSHLRHIASKENIGIDDASLIQIARKADGSMRDSQSIFDQVVAFCGTTITIADLSAALHLIDVDFYFTMGSAIGAHDVGAMFDLANKVVQRGYDLQECLVGLLEHYRNILTVITTGTTDLIEAAATDRQRYQMAAESTTKEDVLRIMAMISKGEDVLRHNPPQPRVRFEFTLVQLAAMDSTVDLGTVIAALNAPGSASGRSESIPNAVGGVAASRVQPVRLSGPVIIKGAEQNVSSLSSGNLAQRWPEILEQLPANLAFVRDAVRMNVLAADFTELGVILRTHSVVVHERLLASITLLKNHLSEVYGAPVGVQCIEPRKGARVTGSLTESPGISPSSAPTPAPTIEQLPIEDALVRIFQAKRIRTN